ncbi:MAG: hypothetical protein U0174_14770 [Polyangiaceae bacterium]
MLPLLFNVLQTIAVEDRTEVRARAVDSELVADVETDPRAQYKAEWKNGLDAFSLYYGPRIVFTNFTGTEPAAGVDNDVRQLDYLHRGGGALQLRLAPLTSVALTGNVTYGKASLGTILIQPRWNGEDRPAAPLPFPQIGPRRLEVLSSFSSANVFHQVSPRLWIQPGFVFVTYGAPTFEGQKVQPYLENPALRFELNYSMSPRDDFNFEIQPQVNLFTSTQEIPEFDASGKAKDPEVDAQGNRVKPATFESRTAPPLYQTYAEARFKHHFSELVSAELSGGTSFTVQDRSILKEDLYNVKRNPTQIETQVYPIAEVAFIAGFRPSTGTRGRFYGYSRLNPWLSSLTGEVLRRVDNVLALSITAGRNTFRAQGAVAITLPNELQPYRQVTGELGYERRVSPEFSLDVGARIGYQVADLPNFAKGGVLEEVSTVQPGGYVGIAYRPLPLKL